jgi:DNA-binding CsgD family transcriptional regulator/PAS domain-containing protein
MTFIKKYLLLGIFQILVLKTMETIRFDELKKSWQQIAKNEFSDVPPDFELDIHRKMINIFQLGNYYYFIFNLAKTEIEFVSDSVTEVLGIAPNEFTPGFVFNNIHQNDRDRFTYNEQNLTTFFSQLSPNKIFKYKISYDYRLLNRDGKYIWLHQQMMALQSTEDGAIIRTLGIHTDISHLKTEPKPIGMTIAGMDGEPSYFNVQPGTQSFVLQPATQRFTKREKEIYRLVINGCTSAKIAEMLFISPQTVYTHRKHILQKSGCANWIEFTSKVLINGW